MAREAGRQDDISGFVMRFGGGVHSRASEEDIDPRECAAGENGLLHVGDQQFRPRPAFDLIGTLPNGSEVRGGATLLKTDGTVSTLFQGGDSVYEWDGGTVFTKVATVSATAKIRGRLEHNWQLTDKVLITDLNLVDAVKEWDGTTFQAVTFTDEDGGAFGTFKARYCFVSNERAIFANVVAGSTTPHLIVGSKRADYTQITVANRPSSALSDEDPWYIPQPNNRYINGLVEAFGRVIISSKLGAIHVLEGQSAKDFNIRVLQHRAGVVGDESMVAGGDDVFFGRQGAVESVRDTDKLGDVELNDISFWISDQVEAFNDWLLVNNRRINRTYCHPVGQSLIWVLHESVLRQGELSPWMKYTTAHEFGMSPNFMMNMLDPSDGLEYVFMGDGAGNIYRLEGTGTGGDGGANAIKAFRLSSLMTPPDGKMFDLEGSIRYRKNNAVTARLTFEFSGEHVIQNAIDIDFPATAFAPVYGTTYYYGTQNYYGTDDSILSRRRFAVPGGGTDLQVRITVDETATWTINQVAVKLKKAG